MRPAGLPWGPLRVIWGPYAALHTHRGRSHNSLFGPLSRLLYLALPGRS